MSGLNDSALQAGTGPGGGSGTVTSVTGTAGRISITGNPTINPTIDIDSGYVGQTSITTLGTISSGTWQGTPIAAVNGGTGQTSYSVGDILYASTTTALSKLAGVATGNALISGGVNVAPSWGKIGLTTHVSGTLPVANGGTGVTTFGGTNRILYTTTADNISSSGNLTYDGTTVLLTSDTATIRLRSLIGTTSTAALYLNQSSPSATNYTIVATSNVTTVNCQTSINLSGAGTPRFTITASGFVTHNTSAAAASPAIAYRLTPGAHTALPASTENPDVFFESARLVQFATGALTIQRFVKIDRPSISFVGASTVTDAATVGIMGAVGVSTNATITNTHALLISSTATAGGTNSYGLTVNAQTGATNNYSAQFIGGLGVLMSATNIVTDTTTGLKIGTATTQKVGFFNVTPKVQQAAIGSPTGGLVVDTQARAAIDSILAVINSSGTGFGFTA